MVGTTKVAEVVIDNTYTVVKVVEKSGRSLIAETYLFRPRETLLNWQRIIRNWIVSTICINTAEQVAHEIPMALRTLSGAVY